MTELYTPGIEARLLEQIQHNILSLLDFSLYYAPAKMLKSLEGHSKSVFCISILPNGLIVSGSEDNTLRIWSPQTGQCLQTLTGHTNTVYCVAVLPNGQVVSGSEDETLRVWNPQTGQCLQTLTGHTNTVYCVAVLPNGQVVSGSEDETLRVWNPQTGQCLQTLIGHTNTVYCVAVLPNGQVVSGSGGGYNFKLGGGDYTLKLWNLDSRQCLQTLRGHKYAVRSVAVLPDGQVVSSSTDNTLKVWKVSLSYQDVASVLEALGKHALRALILNGVQLGNEGFEYVFSLIQTYRTLEYLSLVETGLTIEQYVTLQRAQQERHEAGHPVFVKLFSLPSFHALLSTNKLDLFNICHRLAEQKHPFAQFHLGCLYLQGLDVVQNTETALMCFQEVALEKSALQPVALLALGFLYQTGYGQIPPQLGKTQIWLEKLEKFNLNDGTLQDTLEQLLAFRIDSFFYALFGYFYECRSKLRPEEALKAPTYYTKAVEYADLSAVSAQTALKERVEPAIKAYHFQQLIAQQALQQRQQVAYQEQDKALQAQILSISEPDKLDVLLDNVNSSGLSKTLKIHQHRKQVEQLAFIIACSMHARTLLQRRTYAYPTVITNIKKHHQQQFSVSKIFKAPMPLASMKAQLDYFGETIIPLQHKTLTQLLKLKFLSKEQKSALLQLRTYLELVQKRSPNQPPPILIHESLHDTRILKPEFAARLFPKGKLVSDTERGSHPVIILNGVHYKCAADEGMMPIAPGIEYMVDRLNKLLAGHGSAPTALLKITQGERAIIYQASKTVTGVDLQYILEKKPEYLAYLDKNNFSAMTILGILTNPQDGKADNYMVEIDADRDEQGKERIKALHIVGIDNDMAFGTAVEHLHFQDGTERFASKVRNVLFLFPQMEEPLDNEFRDQFLKCSPELLLIEWLKALAQRNESYERLLAQGIFTQVDFSGCHSQDKGLQLPIILPSGLVRDIYRKLIKLQAYVRQYSDATHQALLAHVEPIVAKEYQWARDTFSDLIEGVYHMYEASLGEDLKSRLAHTVDDFHTVASRLIYESAPKRKRELSIAEAVKELILSIQWPNFNDAQQQVLLQALDPMTLLSPTELLHQLMTQTNTTTPLVLFLLNHGAQLGPVHELHGYHALHTAVRTYSLDFVDLLLKQGADINGKDDSRDTPLDKLLKEENPKKIDERTVLIEFLLAQGAKFNEKYKSRLDETLEKIKAAKAQVQLPNIKENPVAPPSHLQFLQPPLPRDSIPGQQSQHPDHAFVSDNIIIIENNKPNNQNQFPYQNNDNSFR